MPANIGPKTLSVREGMFGKKHTIQLTDSFVHALTDCAAGENTVALAAAIGVEDGDDLVKRLEEARKTLSAEFAKQGLPDNSEFIAKVTSAYRSSQETSLQ